MSGLLGLFASVNVNKTEVNKLMENITQTINSSLYDYSTSTSATANLSQDIEITFGPQSVTDCTNINITEDVKLKLQSIANITTAQTTSMANAVANNLTDYVQNQVKQQNPGFHLGPEVNVSSTSDSFT